MSETSNNPTPRHRGSSRSRDLRASALLIVTALLLSGCSLFGGQASASTHVGADGGVVASADKTVSVRFAPADIRRGADVSVVTGDDGPAPLAGVEPLTRPFTIDVRHGATGGVVTVRYRAPAGTSGTDSSQLVMVIGEHGVWKLLPTTVDTAKGTVTARWPHFSKGYPAVLDPLFDPIGTAEQAAGRAADVAGKAKDAAKQAAKKVGDAATDIGDTVAQHASDAVWSWEAFGKGVYRKAMSLQDAADQVATDLIAGAVGATGGTIHAVTCTPATTDWTFSNTVGMTGCAQPRNADGLWVTPVNDRYPYPLLITLPRGVIGPGFNDFPDSIGISDRLFALAASRFDREIIPAGGTLPLRFRAGAAQQVRIGGVMDPFTLSIKAVALVAAYFTRGESAEATAAAEAEIAALEEAADARFLAATKADSGAYTLAEYIAETQGDASEIQQRKAALQRTKNAHALEIAFDTMDFFDCTFAVTRDAGKGGFTDQFTAASKQLLDKCFPQFAEKVASSGVEAAGKYLDPSEQARLAGEQAKVLITQSKSIITLTAASTAQRLKDRTGVDFSTASVTATAALSAGNLPDTGPSNACPAPPATPIPGADSPLRCASVAHLDLDGDGKPDEVVLWRSDTRRGAVAVLDDGTVHALEPTPQTEAHSTARWSEGLTSPLEFPGSLDVATPLGVVRSADGRDLLLVATYEGGRGDDVWVLGLDTGDRLRFIADSSSAATAYSYSAAGGRPGCIAQTPASTLRSTCPAAAG